MKKIILVFIGCVFVSFPLQIRADTCGLVSCKNLTGNQSKKVFERLVRDAGTDCKKINTIKYLEKSKLGIMSIYELVCHDGNQLSKYQIIHWINDKEIIIEKFTGSWMDSITIKY